MDNENHSHGIVKKLAFAELQIGEEQIQSCSYSSMAQTNLL